MVQCPSDNFVVACWFVLSFFLSVIDCLFVRSLIFCLQYLTFKVQCHADHIPFPGQNTCFEMSDDTTTWSNARNYCEDKEGFLALVKDNETHNFLKNNLRINTNSWIGGKAGRNWKWRSGKYMFLHFITVIFW